MDRSKQRDIATSLTILVFLIVGTSGVMMYFHLFDTSIKQMHEVLGLVFVVAALLHVLVHIKSTKQYFTKKIFLGFALVFTGVVTAFVLNASGGENPKKAVFDKLFNTPVEKSFALFGDDMQKLKEKLSDAGIKTEGFETIGQIAKNNKTSPFHIIAIISK